MHAALNSCTSSHLFQSVIGSDSQIRNTKQLHMFRFGSLMHQYSVVGIQGQKMGVSMFSKIVFKSQHGFASWCVSISSGDGLLILYVRGCYTSPFLPQQTETGARAAEVIKTGDTNTNTQLAWLFSSSLRWLIFLTPTHIAAHTNTHMLTHKPTEAMQTHKLQPAGHKQTSTPTPSLSIPKHTLFICSQHNDASNSCSLLGHACMCVCVCVCVCVCACV